MPSLIKRLIFSALAVVLFFVLLEGTLWVMGGLESRWRSQDEGAHPGKRLLLAAGDSVTFGLGASTEESYPAWLRRSPFATAHQLEVVNIGRAGQTMKDAVRDAEVYLGAHPARGGILLLLAGFNDCIHLPGIAGAATPYQTRVRPVRDFLVKTRTYRLMMHWISRAREAEKTPVLLPAPGQGQDVKVCRSLLGGPGMDRALKLTRAKDFELIIATYPVPVGRALVSVPLVTTQVNAFLREEAQARSLPVIDLEPCVAAAERRSSEIFFNQDGIHLFGIGYRAMAECIAQEMGKLEGFQRPVTLQSQ